jgi:pyridoxamine 5'-phosphate oxidase family protein
VRTAGFDITKTVRYRNIAANPHAAVVVDDLAAVEPWTPRGVKVRGTARIEEAVGGQRFRITPQVIWSWGINEPGEGIPQIERREVTP